MKLFWRSHYTTRTTIMFLDLPFPDWILRDVKQTAVDRSDLVVKILKVIETSLNLSCVVGKWVSLVFYYDTYNKHKPLSSGSMRWHWTDIAQLMTLNTKKRPKVNMRCSFGILIACAPINMCLTFLPEWFQAAAGWHQGFSLQLDSINIHSTASTSDFQSTTLTPESNCIYTKTANQEMDDVGISNKGNNHHGGTISFP